MKNLIHVSIFALAAASLNSCASISNVVDDDVYVVKPSQIPFGESLDDETSYAAYKYKKEKDNNLIRYQGVNNGFGGGFNNGFNTASYAYNPYMYNYMYSPYGYNAYNPGSWAYMPGQGWIFVLNPYGSGYGYGYGGSHFGYNYGNYGYAGYGNYGYGGYGGYGTGFFGTNGYYGGNGYWYGDPTYYGNTGGYYGNTGGSYNGPTNGSTHSKGPRGGTSGGGVVTRRNAPGTVKMGNASTPMASTSPTFGQVGTIEKSRAVGKENIVTNRGGNTASPTRNTGSTGASGTSTASDVTGTSTTLNRPGRVYNSPTIVEGRNPGSTTQGSGRTYNSGTPSRANGTYQSTGSPSRSSESESTPSRSSGSSESAPSRSSGSSESTPSRNSSPREYTAPTRSTESSPSRSSGSGNSGSSGSGSSRSSGGGSTGGGRR